MDPYSLTPILATATASGGESVGTIEGLLLFVSLALGFSFLCSILEASILSTPTSYIETQAQSGTRAGRWMRQHKQNIEDPITAILTLNTMAATVGAAGAGAQAVGVFGEQYFFLITAIFTLLILTVSEILPKTLGAVYWKQLFGFTSYTLKLLVLVLYPAVWAFRYVTNRITSDEKMPTVTRRELEVMAQISAVEGALEEKESRILRNLLHLSGVQVADIMTPRTVMFRFQQDMTVRDVIDRHRALPYSRIPVYEDNVDDIVGFVLRHDILTCAAEDRLDVKLKSLARPLHPVPETLSVTRVLDEFISRQEHIFLAFDEHGGTSGIITLEDALESLLGAEITDESDIVADMRQLAQQRYLRQKSLADASTRPPAT